LNGKLRAGSHPNASGTDQDYQPAPTVGPTLDVDSTGIAPGSVVPLDIFLIHGGSVVPSLTIEVTQKPCSPKAATSLETIVPEAMSTFGAATINADSVRLVPATPSVAGAVWRSVPIGWTEAGIRTEFDWVAGPSDVSFAEGFAVVFAPAPGVGAANGGLGYAGLPSLAIEFDNVTNRDLSDPSCEHVSIHTRGAEPNDAAESASLGTSICDGGGPLYSLHWMYGTRRHATVEIDFPPGSLNNPVSFTATVRVYVDNGLYSEQPGTYTSADPTIPVVVASVPGDLLLEALGDEPDVFVGITASTSASHYGYVDISKWQVAAISIDRSTIPESWMPTYFPYETQIVREPVQSDGHRTLSDVGQRARSATPS
jgi:hypothetical protein